MDKNFSRENYSTLKLEWSTSGLFWYEKEENCNGVGPVRSTCKVKVPQFRLSWVLKGGQVLGVVQSFSSEEGGTVRGGGWKT